MTAFRTSSKLPFVALLLSLQTSPAASVPLVAMNNAKTKWVWHSSLNCLGQSLSLLCLCLHFRVTRPGHDLDRSLLCCPWILEGLQVRAFDSYTNSQVWTQPTSQTVIHASRHWATWTLLFFLFLFQFFMVWEALCFMVLTFHRKDLGRFCQLKHDHQRCMTCWLAFGVFISTYK